ncbi:MAG: helix-turn-helix transcriptional regulator [Christensenellaceae bacterium]|nr:helix-turn-helix transcriptional regulator [Christensenellaceae bacterium]
MKSFAENVRRAREEAGLSQEEFGKLIGVSRRAVVAYETTSTKPRSGVLNLMPRALGVSKEYLTNPEIEDPSYGQDRSPYIEDVREKYGDHAASEVENLLGQASALFAGGSIDEAGKDAFFQALVEVYAQSKVDAKEKFGRKRKSDR